MLTPKTSKMCYKFVKSISIKKDSSKEIARMGSETAPLRLPVIDFSKVEKSGTPEWTSVMAGVRKALEEYGWFEAKFDKMPMELRKSIFDALEEVFELPLETKVRNVSEKPFHGYVGQYTEFPLFESLGIEDPTVPLSVESFSSILWPQGNHAFRETILSYSEKLAELDQIIKRMVVESLGLEKYMEEHMEATNNYLLRFMKYKGHETEENMLGLTAHTDKNIVTLLHQNQVDGLQIQTKDGQWIAVDPEPNSFIALIGDSLHAWTNGRLYSPYHRVMMIGEEARYSTGMFSMTKVGYVVEAPEELVDEENPRLFEPFDNVPLNYTRMS